MTLAGDLLTLLQQDTSGDVTGHGAVWRIAGNARAVQHCKSRLLGIICAQADIYIRYDEAPEAEPALARAQAIDRDTWWLPAPTAGADVQAWLQPGNWQLYVADRPLAEIPDLCRATDAEVAVFVRRAGVTVIVDSFHDDVAWVVGLGQDR